MANNVAPIAMPNQQSNRTDKGLVQRVQKVQRDAKLNRASGGTYNARNTMNSLTVGTNIPTTGSAVSQDVNVTPPPPPPGSGVKSVGMFEPGSAMAGTPYSDGSPYGPGKTSTNIPSPQAPDNGSEIGRAHV